MDHKKYTDRLIQGSRNINKMRDEIELFIGTVMANIPLCGIHPEIMAGESESDECMWGLRVTRQNKMVECWRKTGSLAIAYSLKDKESSLLYGTNVQFVHEHLPMFLEAARKTCPTVIQACQWLVDASDAKLSH